MRYIELNPVRANMVELPGEYQWSSYQANGYGMEDDRLTQHPLYAALGKNTEERCHAYRELFSNHLSYKQLHEIRDSLKQELVLGRDDFKEKIAKMTNRTVVPGTPGRPKVLEQGAIYYVY